MQVSDMSKIKEDFDKTKLSRNTVVQVAPSKWVKGKILQQMTGLSTEAARKKRERGEWLEGKHWKYAPDGMVWYNWQEIDRWVEQCR